jgi:hypothetical protein
MTNLELENWKLARAQGRARFICKTILTKGLWFAIPVAITLLVVFCKQEQPGGFWSANQLLIWCFAGVSLLVGFGDGLFVWMIREREYRRKMHFLDQPLPQRHMLPSAGRNRGAITGNYIVSLDETLPEDALIEEARRLAGAQTRGLVDLDVECARFHPIFKMSLAEDIFCLASRAQVCEKAAFVALMTQYEN